MDKNSIISPRAKYFVSMAKKEKIQGCSLARHMHPVMSNITRIIMRKDAKEKNLKRSKEIVWKIERNFIETSENTVKASPEAKELIIKVE